MRKGFHLLADIIRTVGDARRGSAAGAAGVDLLAEGLIPVLGPQALHLEVATHALEGIPLLQEGEFLLGAVAGRVVARAVRAHPVRDGLDQARALAAV